MGRASSQNGGRWGAFRILTGKPTGKRPLGRPRRRWVDSAQDRNCWRALVNAALNLRIP